MRKVGRWFYEAGNPPEPTGDWSNSRWWHVVIGGPLVALATFYLIWGFAILGYALEGGL